MNLKNYSDIINSPEVISVWRELLIELNEKLEVEQRKYPLSERDIIWADTLRKILDKLSL